MPITTIDPATALLVIDLQVGLVDAPTIHPVRAIATRAGTLAAAFRKEGLPVVFVNVEAAGATDFLPELRSPRKPAIQRSSAAVAGLSARPSPPASSPCRPATVCWIRRFVRCRFRRVLHRSQRHV